MSGKLLKTNLIAGLIILLIVSALCGNAYAKSTKVDLSGATIVFPAGNAKLAAAAKMLQYEIEIRTGIKLDVVTSKPAGKWGIVIGTSSQMPKGIKLPTKVGGKEEAQLWSTPLIPNKAEGYALWVDAMTVIPDIYCIGYDDRGALFAAGRLLRELYLAENYITLPRHFKTASAPDMPIRAHQIICSTQSEDKLVDWRDPASVKQHIRDLVIFGTNGFEARPPEHVDDYMESLGIDLYTIVTCEKVIELDKLSDEEIKKDLSNLVGVDHITTYGGDASGSTAPQLFFDKMNRVTSLVKEGLGGDVKWWYSNQCLKAHAEDHDDYIFSYFQKNKPEWLYGMVYGPWTKRGINEIRADLPGQYVIRQYPEICHVRWCQYPVPEWDRVWAAVWPRSQSIYAMGAMMTQVHMATRKNTVGFLPYNHTGCYNDLNKFAWSAAGWEENPDADAMLRDYARVFFAYQFTGPKGMSSVVPKDVMIEAGTNSVARGLKLLEKNWTGPIRFTTSPQEALRVWKNIAKSMGGVGKNWRLEMFLYRAFIDAQVKRKYDADREAVERAYEILEGAETDSAVAEAISKAKATMALVDTEFQSAEDFKTELKSWNLSDKFGDLDEIVSNIYQPLHDRKWLERKLAEAKTAADIKKIVDYEEAGDGGFYDNLGSPGKQPHLVKPKTWAEDPGYVYTTIDWVDYKPGSDWRHSQMTHAVARYDSPLKMRWDGLDRDASYRIKVVYRGPFGPQFTCKTDEGILVHGVRGNTEEEPVEYAIPREATKDGVLGLEWNLVNEVRGVSVTEIWLIKN